MPRKIEPFCAVKMQAILRALLHSRGKGYEIVGASSRRPPCLISRAAVEIILVCVRWYCKYWSSYRDLEEMMSEPPRPDPDRPDSSIRLLPRVFDGEALIRPGMKDTRRGKPAVGQFRQPIPREAVLLAAPPERSAPEVGQVMPERRKRPTICGYRIIGEMTRNDLSQPVTLSWDSLVHSQPQLRLDFLELRPHAVAPGLPLKFEGSPARFTADEGEAQECEGLRSTDTAFFAIGRRAAAELDQRVLPGWSDSAMTSIFSVSRRYPAPLTTRYS
jgi:hypothetical protein